MSDLSVARNFVFNHLVGPTLAQGIVFYLYHADPDPGFACFTIIGCIYLFFTLPFIYKYTGNLRRSAFISVQLLTFTSLFGTYYYGGVSSPFLPWLIIALLLGFFYFSDRPKLVITMFATNVLGLIAAYAAYGFPELVPISELSTVGWVSIFSATTYMSWMALFYADVMSMRSAVEKETELLRVATDKLRDAKKRAEAANNARSVFLAKMSHELRTPLNAVIGYSELIMESMDPSKASAQKVKDLERINSSGRHLLSLVNEVLDLSKVESDIVELKEEEFDVEEYSKEVIATAEPLVKANGNQFVVQRLAPLGKINGDRTKLRQVALNLLSNAAKFTKGGTVSLILNRKFIGQDEWFEVQVTDTGIGISEDAIAKLFDNYTQATADTAHKYGGTGLGLAITQKLCFLMGASITVTSELGRGSCFTIRIPVDTSLNTKPAAADSDATLEIEMAA